MVKWLGLGTFSVRGQGSILGWGTKILQAAWALPTKQKNPMKTHLTK